MTEEEHYEVKHLRATKEYIYDQVSTAVKKLATYGIKVKRLGPNQYELQAADEHNAEVVIRTIVDQSGITSAYRIFKIPGARYDMTKPAERTTYETNGLDQGRLDMMTKYMREEFMIALVSFSTLQDRTDYYMKKLALIGESLDTFGGDAAFDRKEKGKIYARYGDIKGPLEPIVEEAKRRAQTGEWFEVRMLFSQLLKKYYFPTASKASFKFVPSATEEIRGYNYFSMSFKTHTDGGAKKEVFEAYTKLLTKDRPDDPFNPSFNEILGKFEGQDFDKSLIRKVFKNKAQYEQYVNDGRSFKNIDLSEKGKQVIAALYVNGLDATHSDNPVVAYLHPESNPGWASFNVSFL